MFYYSFTKSLKEIYLPNHPISVYYLEQFRNWFNNADRITKAQDGIAIQVVTSNLRRT